MNSSRIKNMFKYIPPTRGLRYKETLHSLMQKNSFKNVNKRQNKFQTFTLIWNDNFTRFKPIETTNILR